MYLSYFLGGVGIRQVERNHHGLDRVALGSASQLRGNLELTRASNYHSQNFGALPLYFRIFDNVLPITRKFCPKVPGARY
jgi:hypothetical protein